MSEYDYSPDADAQLDELEKGADMNLYNAVLQAIDLVFEHPREARRRSSAVTSDDGIVYRLPVVGHRPYKVFWTSAGPSIEAVFPHP